MNNQQNAIPQLPIAAPARRNILAAAMRCALAEPRPGPRLPARLLALGLAAHGVGAWAAGPFPPEFELSSLLPANGGDGSAGFVLHGIDTDDRSGCSVSAAGDVNGDGIDDSSSARTTPIRAVERMPGESYVVFGRDPAAGGFPAGSSSRACCRRAGGDGSAGFVLNGIDAYDYSGVSVSAAGDVNGDGIDDLIDRRASRRPAVGMPARATSCSGATPRSGELPAEFELASLLPANGGDGSAGFVLNGIDAGDRLGPVGERGGRRQRRRHRRSPHRRASRRPGRTMRMPARATSCSGATPRRRGFPAEFELSSLLPANGGDGSAGFVLNGIDAYDYSGCVGERGGRCQRRRHRRSPHRRASRRSRRTDAAGESYVVFGRDPRSGDFPAEFELSSLLPANGGDGSAGFVLNGIDAGDSLGRSVSAAGDVNGDGIDDLLIGASRADPGGRSDAGESYVVFGRDTAQRGTSRPSSSSRACCRRAAATAARASC